MAGRVSALHAGNGEPLIAVHASAR